MNTDRLASQISRKKNPKYPVSFVGSLYEKNSYDAIADKLPPYLCGYLEGAMNAQILISGGNLLEKLMTDDICIMLEDIMDYHKSKRSFASVQALFSSTVLGFKAAALERQQNLNALGLSLRSISDFFEVHLFTNSVTECLPLVSVHGPVDYLREMPQIFYESNVNLNMTIPNIKTGIPLRVWDILGSGGFLLSNYQPEFDDYFKAGETLDIFEDKEELVEKAAFYLQHESLRKKIAKQGREYVARYHNYTMRLNILFGIVTKYLV